MKLSGKCLCGAVNVKMNSAPQMAGHCYCNDCRKSSGTGHCTHAAFLESDVAIDGVLKFYESTADSGSEISRGFCPNCGSAIASKNANMPGMIFIRASCIDEKDAIIPQMSVYASRAPKWDLPPKDLPSFDEMPPQMPI